jgi:hypothetical protein
MTMYYSMKELMFMEIQRLERELKDLKENGENSEIAKRLRAHESNQGLPQ